MIVAPTPAIGKAAFNFCGKVDSAPAMATMISRGIDIIVVVFVFGFTVMIIMESVKPVRSRFNAPVSVPKTSIENGFPAFKRSVTLRALVTSALRYILSTDLWTLPKIVAKTTPPIMPSNTTSPNTQRHHLRRRRGFFGGCPPPFGICGVCCCCSRRADRLMISLSILAPN